MGAAAGVLTKPELPKRPAYIVWAVLIVRIYVVFPLLCPFCSGQMRIITCSADIRLIPEHIGVPADPPRTESAHGSPMWDGVDAQAVEGIEPLPDWDEWYQAAPDFEGDQRISW